MRRWPLGTDAAWIGHDAGGAVAADHDVVAAELLREHFDKVIGIDAVFAVVRCAGVTTG